VSGLELHRPEDVADASMLLPQRTSTRRGRDRGRVETSASSPPHCGPSLPLRAAAVADRWFEVEHPRREPTLGALHGRRQSR